MSHSFSKNHIHLVFSTKDRRRTISEAIQPEMWAYLAGICRNQKMVSVAIGGVEDHVHLLFHLPPTISLAKAISVLKANSSRWMDERGIKFDWQQGYGAFSVSASNLAAVSRYIRDQKTHHRKFSFEDEFLTLLRKHKVEFDPESVFGECRPWRGSSFWCLLSQRSRAGLRNFAPAALVRLRYNPFTSRST